MAKRALSVDHRDRRNSEFEGCFAWVFALVFLAAGSVMFFFFTIRPVYGYYRARSWDEMPCVITSSKVGKHGDEDGDTYTIDVTYDYEVVGQKYSGDTYSPFHKDFSSSGYSSKKAVVDSIPKGTNTVCFVNPDAPGESVLVCELSASVFLAFFPLPFLLVGLISTGYLIRKTLRGPTEDDARVGSEDSESRAGVRDLAAIADDGPIQLEAASSLTGYFVGALLVAIFWNGLLMVFLVPVVEGFATGNPPGFSALFLLPFVVIGLKLIHVTLRSAVSLTSPRPLLTLSRGAIPRGESAMLSWEFDRRASSIRRLKISIVHDESATYDVGTDTKTDTETIYKDVLFEAQGMQPMGTGQVEVEIPTNLMHSLDGGYNKIEWAFEVHGDISHRPDMEARFKFRVV